MGDRARIYDVESLRDFRPALIAFREQVAAALSSAEADAGRVLGRLQTEQLPYWKREIRRREDELHRTKSEMSMKKVMRDGEGRATVDDRKAVERAKRSLEEAQEKYRITRSWIQRLDKEVMRFVGRIKPLKSAVAADVPRMVAELDRLAEALDAYLAMEPPAESSARQTAPRAEDEDTRRDETP